MTTRVLSMLVCLLLAVGVLTPLTALAANDETTDLPDDSLLRLRYTFENGQAVNVAETGSEWDGEIVGNLSQGAAEDSVFGNGLKFEGGYVRLPNNLLTGMKDMTLSVWIKPQNTANWSRVWDLGTGTSVNAYLSPNTGSKMTFSIDPNSNYINTRIADNNRWQLVTVTFEETASNNVVAKMYVDGKLVNSSESGSDMGGRWQTTLTSYYQATTSNYIGKSQHAADANFSGVMEDFRLYTGAISAEEVKALARQGFDSMEQTAVDNLEIAGFGANPSSLEQIEANLELPNNDTIHPAGGGFSISWTSSNTSVVRDDGTVIRPALGQPVGEATLTGVLTKGSFIYEKTFEITVKPFETEIVIDPNEEVVTPLGEYPELPPTIMANNGQLTLNVEWNNIAQWQYSQINTFEATGKVLETGADVRVTVTSDPTVFKNPIVQPGSGTGGSADPYVTYQDGWYYYVKSENDAAIVVSKARRLEDVGVTERSRVWTAPSGTMYSKELWAPEIHFIDGNWYIYVAADDGNNFNHKMYVLEATDPNDPLKPFVFKGEVAPTFYNEATDEWEIDPAQNKWGIDGTVIQDEVSGKNYYVWSGWEGDVNVAQNIYIAEMENPWTLKGDRYLLSIPEYDWEKQGSNGVDLPHINEGPQIVTYEDSVYIIYSASGSWSNYYCLGMLKANLGDDLTQKDNWYKHDQALFSASPYPEYQAYSTGHASLTVSPDEAEHWMVYHAYQISGGGWGDRSARAQKYEWMYDEKIGWMPDFGEPVAYGAYIQQPSGTPDVDVSWFEAEGGTLLGNASVGSQYRASNGGVVALSSGSQLQFELKNIAAGEYTLTFMGSTNGSNATQTVDVNGATYEISHPNYGNNNFTPQVITVELNNGDNTITVSHQSGAAANVDFMVVLPAEDGDTPEPPEPVDKSALLQAIQQAEALDEEDYDPDLWASLEEALSEAKEIDDNENATQQQVNDATEKLLAAIEALRGGSELVEVESIEIDAAAIVILGKGDTLKLDAIITPSNASDQTITWASSTPTIATIDEEGVVRGIKSGTVRITATASNGKTTAIAVRVTA